MNVVAIVVLSYNRLDISNKFINLFVENTDPKKVRLFWIDNGSTDGTIDFLKSFKSNIKINLIQNGYNNGIIGGRNQGFKLFLEQDNTIDHLMFLDNDQFVAKKWLEDHLYVLSFGYDVVGVEAWQMNNRFLPIRRNKHISQTFSYVGCGGMLMKRCVPERIGIFDEAFNPCYFEDPDFCFRALDANFKVGWNINAKIQHLAHQTLNNNPDKLENFKKSLLYFRKKWINKTVPSIKQVEL